MKKLFAFALLFVALPMFAQVSSVSETVEPAPIDAQIITTNYDQMVMPGQPFYPTLMYPNLSQDLMLKAALEMSRQEVANLLGKSSVGLVTYLPAPNHVDAQPNKLFEYMSVGLPVIASNFPLWREIVVDNNCGLCVDPTNPKEIADAINYFFNKNSESLKMGLNGKKAVENIYNWNPEEIKLISLYKELLKQ